MFPFRGGIGRHLFVVFPWYHPCHWGPEFNNSSKGRFNFFFIHRPAEYRQIEFLTTQLFRVGFFGLGATNIVVIIWAEDFFIYSKLLKCELLELRLSFLSIITYFFQFPQKLFIINCRNWNLNLRIRVEILGFRLPTYWLSCNFKPCSFIFNHQI